VKKEIGKEGKEGGEGEDHPLRGGQRRSSLNVKSIPHPSRGGKRRTGREGDMGGGGDPLVEVGGKKGTLKDREVGTPWGLRNVKKKSLRLGVRASSSVREPRVTQKNGLKKGLPLFKGKILLSSRARK